MKDFPGTLAYLFVSAFWKMHTNKENESRAENSKHAHRSTVPSDSQATSEIEVEMHAVNPSIYLAAWDCQAVVAIIL